MRHRLAVTAIALAGAFVLGGCGISQDTYDQAQAKVKDQQGTISSPRSKNEKLSAQVDKLDERASKLDRRKKKLDQRVKKLNEREKKIRKAEQERARNTVPGDGVYVVGEDIKPGTYSTDGGSSCYWARLDSTSGGDIITNGLPGGQTTVTISSSDAAFRTRDYGKWHKE